MAFTLQSRSAHFVCCDFLWIGLLVSFWAFVSRNTHLWWQKLVWSVFEFCQGYVFANLNQFDSRNILITNEKRDIYFLNDVFFYGTFFFRVIKPFLSQNTWIDNHEHTLTHFLNSKSLAIRSTPSPTWTNSTSDPHSQTWTRRLIVRALLRGY